MPLAIHQSAALEFLGVLRFPGDTVWLLSVIATLPPWALLQTSQSAFFLRFLVCHTPSVVFIFAVRRKVECWDECPPTYYCDYIPQDLYAIVSPYDVPVSLLQASDNCLVAQTYSHMRSILSKKL